MNRIKTIEKKIGRWADAFLERAKVIMLKRMLNEAKKHNDPLTLKMYAADLADIMHVCYLIKQKDYLTAYDMQRNMDTEPRELFPDRLVNALEVMAYSEEY